MLREILLDIRNRTDEFEEKLRVELRSSALTEAALAKVNDSIYSSLKAESVLKIAQDWRKKGFFMRLLTSKTDNIVGRAR